MDGPDVRRDSNSVFLLGEMGDTVEGAERADAGMEKPTMEEVGRELGFEGDAVRRRDAHDGFGAAGSAGAGVAGCSVVGGSTDCSAATGTDSGTISG